MAAVNSEDTLGLSSAENKGFMWESKIGSYGDPLPSLHTCTARFNFYRSYANHTCLMYMRLLKACIVTFKSAQSVYIFSY